MSQLEVFTRGVLRFLLNMETLLWGIPRILPVSKVTARPKIKKRLWETLVVAGTFVGVSTLQSRQKIHVQITSIIYLDYANCYTQ